MGFIFTVPVEELRRWADPLSGSLWGSEPLHENEIKEAVANGIMEHGCWDCVRHRMQGTQEGRDFHIRRIAYFLSRLPNEDGPLNVAIEPLPEGFEALPSLMPVVIHAGNHRLAAAIIRGDADIEAELVYEDEKTIARLFPGAKKKK